VLAEAKKQYLSPKMDTIRIQLFSTSTTRASPSVIHTNVILKQLSAPSKSFPQQISIILQSHGLPPSNWVEKCRILGEGLQE
jgi:hypothetical protein